MCNYIYEYKKHQLAGLPCIYPSFYEEYSAELSNAVLPIDAGGLCIFHSKDKEWKAQHGFLEKFNEILKLTDDLCKNKKPPKRPYNFSGFYFSGEGKVLQFANWPTGAALEFTFCKFVDPVTIQDSQLNSLNIEFAHFLETFKITNLSFISGINATNAIFHNGITISDTVLEGYNYFDNCIFKNTRNKFENNVRFKNITAEYLNFQNAEFETSVTFNKMIFNGETVFDKTTFLDEFYFHGNKVNAEISFKGAGFKLVENVNPMNSTVDFQGLEITENGKLIFQGATPMEDLIKGELTMNFVAEPAGLISFGNFNLNKIAPSTKSRLFELEKIGKVEIGQGCRKYYCQTEIFTLAAIRPDQALVLDLMKVFCNYFEIHNSYNLGVEIVERQSTFIRYFYFTDEIITKREFEERLKRNGNDLLQTFSNLSIYAGEEMNPALIPEKRAMLSLAHIFLQIRLSILESGFTVDRLGALFSAVPMNNRTVIDKDSFFKAIQNAFPSFDKEKPQVFVIQPVYNDSSITDNSINISGSVTANQGIVNFHSSQNPDDPEMKHLAKESVKWTKKQTVWTIIGVILAAVISLATCG